MSRLPQQATVQGNCEHISPDGKNEGKHTKPPTLFAPGRVTEAKNIPPVKQNLFHVVIIAPSYRRPWVFLRERVISSAPSLVVAAAGSYHSIFPVCGMTSENADTP